MTHPNDTKVLDDWLEAFIDTIGDKEEFNDLSDSAKKLWDKYIETQGAEISKLNFEDIFIFFEVKYGQILNAFYNKHNYYNFITSFNLDMANSFISLSLKYCQEKDTAFQFPDKIEDIIILFCNRVIQDQALYKYVSKGFDENLNAMCGVQKDLNSAVKSLLNSEERMDDVSSEVKEVTKKLHYVQTKINLIDKKAESIKEEITNTETKIADIETKIQERSITILGIFASIVLVFNASISFYSEAIESFSGGSAYRIVFVFSLIGLITLSALMGLLYYLENVRNSQSGQKDKKSKVFKPFIITVTALIVIMWFTWFGGFNKESEIAEEDSSSQTEMTEMTTLEDSN